MNLLILGGTAFVGRALAEAALDKGHTITLFNRGLRNTELFPGIEQLHGDRLDDVSALAGRKWDAVIDCSAYVPRAVTNTSQYLADSCSQYLFISTISVFSEFETPNQDETAPVAQLEDPTVEVVTGDTYGGLKVLCEAKVLEAFGDRATIIRPGLIVGPNDYTDRFTYWPVSMARGGKVIAPAVKDQPVQFIDVRDLSEWCIRLLETGVTGTFNATGPKIPYRLEQVLDACQQGTQSEILWVDPAKLTELGAEAWTDFPFVLDFKGERNGLMQINVDKAVNAGLTYRPLPQTIQDTVAWALSRPEGVPLKAGMSVEKHGQILASLL